MSRRLVLVATSLVIAAGATACGSSDTASPTGSTVTVEASSFATLPTTPVTVAPPQSSLPAVAGEQKYTIQPGDYPISVKDKFGVTLEALDAANTATPGYKEFYAGTEIVIPAGGVPQTTLAPGQTTVPSVAAGPTTTTTTIAGGQPNCGVGSYTLESGDTPSGVAKKFGTTVGELEAINADTNGYSAFYVGLVIKIPAKTAC